jgi:hypothetical protein
MKIFLKILNIINMLKTNKLGICLALIEPRTTINQEMNMKLNIRYTIKSLLMMVLAFTMTHCGGGESNTIRIVVNGQTYELALSNNRCNAGDPSGTGLYNLPIVCSAGFSNTSGLADALVVTVTDVRAVEDALGVFITISPSLLLMTFTLDGTQMAISGGGAVFSKISNLAGGETCFDFQVDSAQAHIEGSFCGNNAVGF